ncbi:peptidoglycan/LPS O-acetylase OafA/YrhL [Pseudarthrobacter sulfonivorans]|nr:peptidoglycan/LPS O-acetylase OafA/YrhL [Pseudarthrobacter sulfonivorans]
MARGGYLGVDIFFVLSGYIITTMLWRSRNVASIGSQYLRFIRRRCARLYPALAGMLVGIFILYAVIHGAPVPAGELILPGLVALVQGSSFYLALGAPDNPFGITWSLSVEWMFYLLWPLAIFWAKRAGFSARKTSSVGMAVAVALFACSLFQDERWFYFSALARMPEIIAGGVLALVLVDSGCRPSLLRPNLAHWGAFVAVALVAAYVLVGPVQWSPIFRWVGLPLSVAATLYLIWIGTRSPQGIAVRALSWSPLALLGRVSYSLYLWHTLAFELLVRDGVPLPRPVAAVLAVVATAILTTLSYRFLELPFMKSQSPAFRHDSGTVTEVETVPSPLTAVADRR